MNIFKINKKRWEDYKKYHIKMISIGDNDPSYPALNYIASRFELNEEQRYWLAFLYQSCYCATTAYYIYNEFPDYENVDVRRLQWWWENNKQKLLFQTDRQKVKSFNKFIPMFESYRKLIGNSQKKFFESLQGNMPEKTYDNLYNWCGKIYYIGRFSLFNFLESIHVLTGLKMKPTGLYLQEAKSCRNGLCYAVGYDKWVTHKKEKDKLNEWQYKFLYASLSKLVKELNEENPKLFINYWNVETSLCSYKKMYWKTRYLGYYIDRLMVEIRKMEKLVTDGVDWSVLWDFRKEFFDRRYLGEFNNWCDIQKSLFGKYKDKITLSDYILTTTPKKEIYFRGIKTAYKKELK